jgi:hypothetical protein
MNPASVKLRTPLDGALAPSARIADAASFSFDSVSNRPPLS